VQPDRIHERADVVGEVAQPVAICWLLGVAMTALVERERAAISWSKHRRESSQAWSSTTGTPSGSPCST